MKETDEKKNRVIFSQIHRHTAYKIKRYDKIVLHLPGFILLPDFDIHNTICLFLYILHL